MYDELLHALGVAGEVLDTPGSIVRGLASGDPRRAFGGIFDPTQRVSGRNLLENYGLVDQKPEGADFDFGDVAGLGASLVTDPLMLIPCLGLGAKAAMGAKTAGKAALAAKAAKAAIPLAEATEVVAPVAKTALAAEKAIPVAKLASEIPVAKPIVPMFYSRLEEAVQKLPESMKSESVLNQLKKAGVTTEEIEATNFGKALEGKPRVTKQQLLDHFGENKIEVTELGSQSGGNFSKYQTPGGKKYRELLFTVPEKKLPEGHSFTTIDNPLAKNGKSVQIVGPDGNVVRQNAIYASEEQALADFNLKNNRKYIDPHWGKDNTIAHVRFNDRVGPNGEKILHIEEVQSDLHQKGAKIGYGKHGKEVSQWPGEQYQVVHRETGDLVGLGANPKEAMDQAILEMGSSDSGNWIVKPNFVPGQPDLPFKKNWDELVMKRMIRYAANNNYDAITLNTGEQINKILESGEQALTGQKVFYDKTLPNWMKKYGKQYGVDVKSSTIEIPGQQLPVTRMDLNPKLREQVLTRGQPLMQVGLPLAGGAGGSALLAALLGQQQQQG